MSDASAELRDLVADVAAAYFSSAHVPVSEIANVIGQIAGALASISAEAMTAQAAPAASPARPTAAMIRKSVTREAVVSFEDGRSYRTLRRHLAARGLTPEQYREKWGLPFDYPMVAPAYSEARSAMAKTIGLGRVTTGRRRSKA